MQSWLLLLLNLIPTVFPLDLYLIYSKRTTKPKTISVLAPSTVIVKGLLAFRLQRFPRKVYNLAVLLGFRLKCCYFCSKANSFYQISCVWCIEGEGWLFFSWCLHGIAVYDVVHSLEMFLHVFIHFVWVLVWIRVLQPACGGLRATWESCCSPSILWSWAWSSGCQTWQWVLCSLCCLTYQCWAHPYTLFLAQ